MDDKVEVLPNIMIIVNMKLKALFGILIEHLPFMVADEAFVFHVSLGIVFLTSQLGESINNNTEDDVEQNCDDDQEECQIINSSEVESLDVFLGSGLSWQVFSDTTTSS